MPDENTLEYFAAQQELVGEEICRIARNYKKDGEGRKTHSYLLRFLEQLEQNWARFDATDSSIREEFSDQLDHPYFKKDYFEEVRKVADRLRDNINDRIECITQKHKDSIPQQEVSNVEEEAAAASIRAEVIGHQGAIPKHMTQLPPVLPRLSRGKEGSLSSEVTPAKPSATINEDERLRMLCTILKGSLDKCSMELAQGRSPQFCQLKSRLIEQNWDEISVIYRKMEERISTRDIETYFNMQDQVEAVLVKLYEHQAAPHGSTAVVNPIMKLPKIELPKFDGNYLNWRPFYELFKQLIHDQPISPAQKLFYLRANVTGDAHSLIQQFQATDANYETAWKTLVERFDNKRLLLTAQLNRMFNQSITIGTAASLRRLHDTTKEVMQSITNLNYNVDNWDPIVVHLMLNKLDKESRVLFEQALDDPRSSPTLTEFLKFLESRFQTLEAISGREERRKSSFLASDKRLEVSNCVICSSGRHQIFNCTQFLNLSGEDREKAVRRLQLCRNCLKVGHYSQSCQSRGCQKCNAKHNTLLHQNQNQQHYSKPAQPQRQNKEGAQQPVSKPVTQSYKVGKSCNSISSQDGQPSNSFANAAVGLRKRHVYLATAVINVISSCGTRIPCRVLLDSGSQLHFITTSFAHELGLKKRQMEIPISGIGAKECKAEFVTNVTIESRTSSYRSTIEASIMPRISDYQPSHEIDTPLWKIPPHMQLADPSYSKPQHIDMLLGADLFFDLLMPGEFKISNELPVLRNTKLGWIVAGSAIVNEKVAHCHVATSPTLSSLDKLVRSFWETESHDTPVNTMSKEEHECETHFRDNTKRNANGQFVVRLPLREEPTKLLGESREMARKRFLSLERKLDKNGELKASYVRFMEEYEELGHMSPIAENEISSTHYVIPHHCVMKPESSSTKLRVVFDASAKSTSGHSLNDILMIGPTVQPDLFSIVANFRMHRYVFTGDISKMYRQISVEPADRMLQLILWRAQHDLPLQIYQLNTVTYGTASAPYLATRCLNRLADDNQAKFPRAAQAIRKGFYVDDCLAGADDIEDAEKLLDEICQLLKLGNFELRKFCANHPQILEKIPEEHKEQLVTFHQSEVIKTLGLIWDPASDAFMFKFDCDETNKLLERVCKRTVLADLARLFDPLGLLGPVVVRGKLFLQELWKTKLAWDDQLPKDQANKWLNYIREFSMLNELSIPRYVSLPLARSLELHAFSDSSLNAFGSCVYLRSIDNKGKIHSELLCSKSRVGPLKATTIARLELQGAVLMVELVARLLQLLSKKINKVCYYTDSTTVLAWIRAPSYTWETYVANRVAKIQANSEIEQWSYIKGEFNPADVISRGLDLQTLLKSHVWFNGPDFLTTDDKSWEVMQYVVPEDIPERRKKRTVLAASTVQIENIAEQVNHRNSFYSLQKIFAYCFRFYNNCRKHKSLRNEGQLTVEELQRGTQFIWVYVQRKAFSDDYRSLQRGSNVHKGSSIASLAPFFDEKTKLIRVGGRLKNASIMDDAKQQILLPKNNCITKLLLTHLHQTHMHAAPRTLIAISRQKYWILSVGRMARQIVSHCIKCFRSNPRPIEQMMGNLPMERVTPSRPFYYCGVDFCGPVKTHYKIRGKGPTKSYLAVFVCFSTKAVHMEVVGDLSAESFIYALKRFIGRRGLCHTIFCDNATNFVGAKSELADLRNAINSEDVQSNIESACLKNGIDWKYIPPRSPHFGGLWESAVKSAKTLLIRYLGESSLTYEQLLTVVIQIEAILNSRPLTPLTSDPNDLEALTPGHFLIGAPLTALPEPDVTDCKLSNISKFRQIMYIQQHFWKRWSAEYLHLLQQRMKWQIESQNLQPGTLVVIKESNAPPMRWKLGRVEAVYPGSDGLVRVASVKTQTGKYQRAVQNLCPLPVEVAVEKEEMIQDVRNRPVENTENEKTIRTKNKVSKRGMLAALLCILLIVPTSFAEPKEQIVIKKLDDAVGIYFEDIGRISAVNKFWSIYVYYNLTTYWQEFGKIRSYLEQMEGICTKDTVHQVYCKPTIQALRHRVTAIEHNNDLLHTFRGPKYERIRMARSPFDIVGTLAHGLFGILDQDDAQRIEDQITTIHENEHHMAELLQKQSSIADSTANLLKRSTAEINQQFQALHLYLTKAAILIEGKQASLEVKQNLASLTSYLLLIITNFERVQQVLLDVVLDLNQAKINPQLITPEQFSEQLHLIRSNLPSALSLPRGSIVDMYRMASVKGRSLNDSVVFEVSLPLTDTEKFQLFNLITVPIFHQNESYVVQTSSPYLAVSLARDRYFPLTEIELARCKSLVPMNYVCTQLHPIHTQRSKLSACEIALLNHKQDALSECVLKPTLLQDYWKALRASNGWIFSVVSRLSAHLICHGNTNPVTIAGSGLLEFQSSCMLKLPTAIINGRVEYNNTLKASFIPSVNISTWTFKRNTTAEIPVSPEVNDIDDSQIFELQQRVDDIIKEAKTLPKHTSMNAHDYHHYGLSYILLAGMIGTVAAFCYYQKRSPTPAPRSSRFQVDV